MENSIIGSNENHIVPSLNQKSIVNEAGPEVTFAGPDPDHKGFNLQ